MEAMSTFSSNCDEEMSLEAFFKSLSITKAVREGR